MSCNGCRVLRKGCNDNCVLRPCLQWIDSADAQGNATVFVAKFFGRAGLMGFIGAVPEDQRAALFQSLLYEACGRTVNPVHGALGLLWSGKWNVCEAAVETVLKGGSLKPPAQAVLAVANAGNNTGGFPRATAGMAAAAPMQQQDCFTMQQQQQQHLLERMPASLTLPRSSPRLNTNRARSSFTGHHSPATANVGDRLAGLVPPSGAPVHELDNASEISSAGTSSRLMSLEAAAEELRRRDMSLSIRQDWEQHQQQRQGGGVGGGGFIGQGKENGGEWRMQHNVSASEISRRTWQETCNPAALAHQQQQQQGGFWFAPALIREDLTRRLQQQQSFDPRVKREYRDVQQGVVASPEPPRRVQPRLELDSSPFKDQTCLEMHETAAAAWEASEAEARGSSGNNGGKVAPMELNLTLNSSFASTAKEQQMRKPSASAGVRVSSPSCGSVNSEGSVTSLHSYKPVVSPWTLQLASESQSNRQLLPLLR